MPVPGHDYGVDTALQLKDLNWGNIHAQRNANPVFAGRYFNPNVSVTWVDEETKNIKAANPDLAHIFPMQSPGLRELTNRVQGIDHIRVEIDPPRVVARAGAVTLSSTGAITAIAVAKGGAGYTAPPAVKIISGSGAGAKATTNINAQGEVTSINVTAGGAGYRSNVRVVVNINAPPAGGATAKAGVVTLSAAGAITNIAVAGGGAGYKKPPAIVIKGGNSEATATAAISALGAVTAINMTSTGSGYHHGITVDIDPPPAPGRKATAGGVSFTSAGAVSGIAIANAGSGYVAAPAVHISSDIGLGAGATATANIAGGQVTSITIVTGGSYRFANVDFVRRWGEVDAKATCSRVWDVVKGGELAFPDSKTVIIYLDIEATVRLNPHYWAGWASSVYWYCTGFFQWPFYPGLYCTTKHNPQDPGASVLLHRVPSDDVQDGLTLPPNGCASRCWGVFATNPQLPNRFDPNYQPDWQNRFDDWVQTVHVFFGLFAWSVKVKVLLWQYGMQGGSPPAFDALHVDLDESSPSGEATRRMLKIP
jgi:hypothetical protein